MIFLNLLICTGSPRKGRALYMTLRITGIRELVLFRLRMVQETRRRRIRRLRIPGLIYIVEIPMRESLGVEETAVR